MKLHDKHSAVTNRMVCMCDAACGGAGAVGEIKSANLRMRASLTNARGVIGGVCKVVLVHPFA